MCIVIKVFEVNLFEEFFCAVSLVIDKVEIKGLIYKNKVSCDKVCFLVKFVK